MAVPYSVKADAFVSEKPRPFLPATVVLPPLDFVPLNAGGQWDLSSDGTRVAALAPVQSTGPAKPEHVIVFLQNFVDEPRRRAPLPQ